MDEKIEIKFALSFVVRDCKGMNHETRSCRDCGVGAVWGARSGSERGSSPADVKSGPSIVYYDH